MDYLIFTYDYGILTGKAKGVLKDKGIHLGPLLLGKGIPETRKVDKSQLGNSEKESANTR